MACAVDTLQKQPIAGHNVNSSSTSSTDILGLNFGNKEDSYTVFTFWSGEQWFAVNVENTLSIAQDLDELQPAPSSLSGALGIIRHQGKPVVICDFSIMLGIPGGLAHKEQLIEDLHSHEQDHVAWVDALETSLISDEPFTKARDPHQCTFGKWYDKFSTYDEELAEILTRFDAPHKAIHALADELLTMKSQGKTDSALEKFRRAKLDTLVALRQNFAHTRKQISQSIRPIILYLTLDGRTPLIGLLIDKVSDVATFAKSDMNGLDSLGFGNTIARQEMFAGYLSKDGSRECLLIDASNIMASINTPTQKSA